MRRTGFAMVLAGALAVTALAACSGDDKPSAGSSPSGSSSPAANPGTAYPVGPTATPSAEPALGTKQARDGWVFTLTGVRRVADDRIVVEGSLDGSKATTNFSVWTEPGYQTLKDANGAVSSPINGEFSAVQLTTAGDASVYLPVRDKNNICLCTRLGAAGGSASMPVYVTMSAPKGTDQVTVNVTGAGTFANQKVTQ
ncbi:hypothetical protein ACPPVT_18480 [Angustibacter sp. McL0619]|uniref:hypothetical protein n=1 Tax=Angustibacter sp. McL0619 TaxID=3415676 RepID=UPI003CF31E7F